MAANPQSSSAHHLLGHFLFSDGDYRGASAAFKKSEDLCIDWEKSEKYPAPSTMPTSVPPFTAPGFQIFFAGRYKEADRIASAVASVPLDKEYPLAPGTLLQIWEARNLPVRLMLANPDLPRQEYVLKASPAPLPKGFPDLSNGMMAMLTQYLGAKYSSQQGGAAAVSARVDKLSGIIRLLMDGAATARQQMSLSYWVRCLQLGNAYAMEIRAMMFPESANIWLSNAIRDQRFASLLLPPVLPYPEEWILARAV